MKTNDLKALNPGNFVTDLQKNMPALQLTMFVSHAMLEFSAARILPTESVER